MTDLQKLGAKIEARIKECEPTHTTHSNEPCRCTSCYVDSIRQSVLFEVLSEIRKIEEQRIKDKKKKWGNIPSIKIEVKK